MQEKPWANQRTPALELVKRGAVHREEDGTFTVESLSRPDAAYAVVENRGAWGCECSHHLLVGRQCIHILAARYWLEVEREMPDGTTKKDKVPLAPSQAWTAYNEAQRAEVRLFEALLRNLTLIVDEPPYAGRGRPALSLREEIFCSVQKVYSQLSSRRASGLFDFAVERGHLKHAPHFNAVTKFLNREEAIPILSGLLRLSAIPVAGVDMDFAIDSSGFRTTSFGPYNQEKHGERREHEWLKAHIATGVKTNVITAAIVTEANAADVQRLPELVEVTAAGFHINDVVADAAYSARYNHDAIGKVGGVAFIPFKKNATGNADGSFLWKKAYHLFQANKEEFYRRYHKRSNVESTFSALKRKFGDTLKSKNHTARVNELLCKFIAYNITVLIQQMHEADIELRFDTAGG